MLVDRFGENLQKELMMQLYCDHTFKQLMSVSGDQPPASAFRSSALLPATLTRCFVCLRR